MGRIGLVAENGASTLGVIATTAAYAAGGPWLGGILDYLDGSRRLLAELVAEQLPGVAYTPPEGTYLAWLGFGFDDPAAHFLHEAGVAPTDGARCGEAGRGFARLTFATPRPVLREAVARIAAALP